MKQQTEYTRMVDDIVLKPAIWQRLMGKHRWWMLPVSKLYEQKEETKYKVGERSENPVMLLIIPPWKDLMFLTQFYYYSRRELTVPA